jgi:hypothetical protein
MLLYKLQTLSKVIWDVKESRKNGWSKDVGRSGCGLYGGARQLELCNTPDCDINRAPPPV